MSKRAKDYTKRFISKAVFEGDSKVSYNIEIKKDGFLFFNKKLDSQESIKIKTSLGYSEEVRFVSGEDEFFRSSFAVAKNSSVSVVIEKPCVRKYLESIKVIFFNADKTDCKDNRTGYEPKNETARVVGKACTKCGAYLPSDTHRDYISEEDVNYCYNCGAEFIKLKV